MLTVQLAEMILFRHSRTNGILGETEISEEEAEAIFKKYKVKKEDFEEEIKYEAEKKWLESRDLNTWQNIRGPRPWEDSKSIQAELRTGSKNTAGTVDAEAEAAAKALKEKRRLKLIRTTLDSYQNWKQESQQILHDYISSDKTQGRVDEQYLSMYRHSQKMLQQLTTGGKIKSKFTDILNAALEEQHDDENLEKVKEANKDLMKNSNRLRQAMLETWQIQDKIRKSRRK